MLKLYHYDHCPYCVRVRMMLEACGFAYTMQVLQYDDKVTTQSLAQTNFTPILTLEDGSSMPESLDIIDYLIQKSGYNLDPRKLPPAICSALGAVREARSKLLKARVLSIGLEEFATESAQQYFYKRWKKTPQIIADDLAKTDEYVKALQPQLQIISDTIQSENFVYDKLAMADIELFPALRSATCVKGLVFPERLNKYMQYHLKQAKVAPLNQI
jgi:glutaredoxin 2